jgi:serine/threonine protein kinase
MTHVPHCIQKDRVEGQMIQRFMTLPIGTVVRGPRKERYTIESTLGVGGFSAVYKVRERYAPQQIFALKEVIQPDTYGRTRLATEAELLMRLHHPSLPCVYKVFENVELKRVYLLMDYIEGKTLEALRDEQPERRFTLDFVIAVMDPVVQALTYLHSQQPPVVHCDIKPGNIIVPTKAARAFLVDFSLAKEYVSDRTTSVLRFGTPGYAAPEQYTQGTNLRTDVYGLGATLYTLLTGTRPVDALARVLNHQKGDTLKRADLLCDAVPASVGRVLACAMRLHNEDRYADIEEFWQALKYAVKHPQDGGTDDDAIARPANAPQVRVSLAQASATRGSVKRPVLLFSTLLGMALIILTAFGFAFLRPLEPVQQPSPPKQSKPAAIVTATVAKVCTATTTFNPDASTYPLLMPCYAGTIDDIGVAKTKTAMYLMDIQQHDGKISGRFQGLHIIGIFEGTIKQNGDIHFIVKMDGKADTISFMGNSKYGGDMRGHFEFLDRNGKATLGEYGSWYVQPYSGSEEA